MKSSHFIEKTGMLGKISCTVWHFLLKSYLKQIRSYY